MTGDIRTWISGRLDPLVEIPQSGLASDYDLAPDMPGLDDPPTLAPCWWPWWSDPAATTSS
jgi:hypothetical protein